MSKKNIVLAVILGLLFIVSTYLGLQKIGGFWLPSIISFGGVILISILIAINARKENDGYASFGTLVKYYVIALGIASIMSIISGTVQLSIMDDSQKEEIIERSIEKVIDMYSGLGFNTQQISEMEDILEEKINTSFKPSTIVMNVIYQFIFYVLITFIPAAIMKKNPPVT
jgi:protein-S-isoprenylcysteine O-methyltransferase Ste14